MFLEKNGRWEEESILRNSIMDNKNKLRYFSLCPKYFVIIQKTKSSPNSETIYNCNGIKTLRMKVTFSLWICKSALL